MKIEKISLQNTFSKDFRVCQAASVIRTYVRSGHPSQNVIIVRYLYHLIRNI